MHALIKNRDLLVAHGFTAGREKAIDIVTYALQSVSARQAVKNRVRLVDDVLKIEDQSFDLRNFRNIFAIGAGKATFPLAAALEEILGELISQGLDIHEFLHRHDIYTLLTAVGDTIETRNTETNVCDIAVAVVL